MGGAAGARDDDFDAAVLRRGRVLEQQVRSAVGGYHAGFIRDRELVERLGRGAHRVPVGGGTHDDADQWFHREILSNKVRRVRNNSREAASRLPESTRVAVALWISACRDLRSASGRHFTSSSSAAGPSVSRRARHAST